MSLIQRIKNLAPNARVNENYELIDRGSGLEFGFWDVYDDEGNFVPSPTVEELRALAEDSQALRVASVETQNILQPGELLTYLGLADDPQLPGGTRLILDFSRDLTGDSAYPIVIPQSGLYEVELSLFAFSGSTTTVEAALELQRAGGAAERLTFGEQFFYNRIPYRQRAVLPFEQGDSFRTSIYWGGASYPKRIAGDWSRLKVSSKNYPLSTLLVRKAK